jgi:hypothetical protein
MPITRSGNMFVNGKYSLEKTSGYSDEYMNTLFKNIYHAATGVGKVFTKVRPPGFFKKIIPTGVKGITAAGKWMYNNPHLSIPLAVGTAIGGKTFANVFKPSLYHIDPSYNVTTRSPLGSIQYNVGADKQLEDYLKNKSISTI